VQLEGTLTAKLPSAGSVASVRRDGAVEVLVVVGLDEDVGAVVGTSSHSSQTYSHSSSSTHEGGNAPPVSCGVDVENVLVAVEVVEVLVLVLVLEVEVALAVEEVALAVDDVTVAVEDVALAVEEVTFAVDEVTLAVEVATVEEALEVDLEVAALDWALDVVGAGPLLPILPEGLTFLSRTLTVRPVGLSPPQ